MDRKGPGVLKMLRFAVLLGLAVLVAGAAGLTLLYRGLVFDSLVEGEEHANVGLTRTFTNAIWPAHGAFVRGAHDIAPPALAGRAEVAALGRALRALAAGTSVVKVKIYDTRGITVFSTDARQIGEDKSANPGVRSALAGTPASGITFREHFDAWEGALSDRNIIASYVPVRVLERAPVEAVMEIYSDVTPLVERMERSLWRILAGVLATLALVLLAGVWILRRYHRLLRAQEAERLAQEERIRHQAYHDALTGLPNRASFTEHLEEAVRRAKRTDWQLALMFLDVDQFKRVNDSLGHEAGDRLLRVLAARIRGRVRETDLLFRMGGDEFTVILEDVHGPEEAAMVAQRVIETTREPLQLAHHELAVSVSVGIAMFPKDDAGGERLVKSADTAMYRAKELGRNRYAFFAPEMNERVESQLLIEAALRRALKNGEFRLHYQPRISAATGRAVGVEALLRWAHPQWGLVEPARFIPALEDSGLIVPVGEWVLGEACRQAAAWRDAGLEPLRVSVNISSRQFRSETLAGAVAEALRASALAPAQLEVELTESLLMENTEQAMAVMGKLKALGIAISIDDFGTGYSSLGYLKRFPIDGLKIDRSFVRDLATSPKDAAIIDAIAALARSLGIGLVAEGVEEPYQAEFLRERQCTELQGYLFGRPVAAEGVAEYLRRPAVLPLRVVP
jgi:diguanylate cyclase (GGDEF)-like protein